MKVSQIITLTATLALQAQACARVRVDRWVADTYNHITEVKLYDNDNPVITHPAINFRTSDDENRLNMGGYTVRLQYKDRNIVPYGGVISYPGGSDRDLQGKAARSYTENGVTHDVWCFTDNYDNCGNYECGVN